MDARPSIDELDTPALVCDLDVLERNIRQMAAHCRELNILLRPQVKTHKIPEIAHLQIAAGATGICCQKLGEAKVIVDAGLMDVPIPLNVVGATKIDRLMRLAARAQMTLSVDSCEVRGPSSRSRIGVGHRGAWTRELSGVLSSINELSEIDMHRKGRSNL